MKHTPSIFLIAISMNLYGQALKDSTAISEFNELHNEGWAYLLYPTQNMYTFIPFDRISGNTYQVQWS